MENKFCKTVQIRSFGGEVEDYIMLKPGYKLKTYTGERIISEYENEHFKNILIKDLAYQLAETIVKASDISVEPIDPLTVSVQETDMHIPKLKIRMQLPVIVKDSVKEE